MTNLQWRRALRACQATMIVGGLCLGLTQSAAAQQAARGRALLSDKGCLECHALLGTGADKAPDLGVQAPDLLSPAGLAALLWNHDVFAPDSPKPEAGGLTQREASDLYAYFDSLRAFDPPGDPLPGRTIFEARCARCHAGSSPLASLASDWEPIADLSDWAERMWNAAAAMSLALDKAGAPWPQFTVRQAADLTAYLQGLTGAMVGPMAPPDQAVGGRIFEQSGCVSCHAFEASREAKIDLSRALNREPTNAGLAIAIVNHRIDMGRAASERRSRLPRLASGSVTHLLAYMRAQGARGAPGNRSRGEHTFRRTGCLGCHGIPRSGAPELKGVGRRYDAYVFGGSVWRHAERARSVAAHVDPVTNWPQLRAREVADLIAFLNGE